MKKKYYWLAIGLLIFGALEVLEGVGFIPKERANFKGFRMEPFQSFGVAAICLLLGLWILFDAAKRSKK